MPAGRYDFVIDQGADRALKFELRDNAGNPINLTDVAEVRSQIRERASDEDLSAEFTAGVFGDPIEGTILISLTNTQTSTLKPGKQFYDVEIVWDNGTVDRLLMGEVTVRPEVTR